MRVLLSALVGLALLLPATATADVAESLRIADDYWGPHPCAGKMQVVFDATLKDRMANGEAIGMVPILNASGGFDWYVAACRIAIMPGLDPVDECGTIAHEVGHLVTLSAAHRGRMAIEADPPRRCEPPLREQIRGMLGAELAPWRVVCTPRSSAMHCRATSRRARYVHLFAASVAPDGYVRWFDKRGLARR